MAKWNFKSCPRCDGDMFVDRDLYGWHEQCLQCGYARELKNMIKSKQRASSEKEKERRVTSSIKA